jgi:hypothetical protein
MGAMSQCGECIVAAHRQLPTHSILIWNQTFWDDYSLAELGLVVHLHHSSDSCQHGADVSSIWVGDILGFSCVNVCYAPLSNENTKGRQLLRFGFFPCSDIAPKSAFTLTALEHFTLFGTLGKNSTHKYYSVLERLTNTGFPDDLPDRYRELALTHRKYLFLLSLKRSGRREPPSTTPRILTRDLSCAHDYDPHGFFTTLWQPCGQYALLDSHSFSHWLSILGL